MIFTAILFLTVFTFETSAEGTIQDLNARIKSLESLIAVHENAIVGLDKQVGEHDTKIGEFDTEITNLQVCIKRITYQHIHPHGKCTTFMFVLRKDLIIVFTM